MNLNIFYRDMVFFAIGQLQLTLTYSHNKVKTLSAPFCSKWYSKKSLRKVSSG